MAERHEIVETLEHDVLFRKVTAVSGVLQPIPRENAVIEDDFGFGRSA